MVIAHTQSDAVKQARITNFYGDFSYSNRDVLLQEISYVDNKMEIEMDDIYQVDSLLSQGRVPSHQLVIEPLGVDNIIKKDKIYMGHLNLKTLKKLDICLLVYFI